MKNQAEQKSGMLTVVIVPPNEDAYAKAIGTDLESIQKEVDGYIEVVKPYGDGSVVLVCDEEGKIKGNKKINRLICDKRGNVVDAIFGTFFVAGVDAHSEAGRAVYQAVQAAQRGGVKAGHEERNG